MIINAALATLDNFFFQYLIGPYEKEKIYLHHPTQNSHYLRRVLMSWFSEGRIEVDYVIPQSDFRRDNVPTKFDHSFSLRQDTAINSRKKLKLSLNHKASSSCGSSQEETKEHSKKGFPNSSADPTSNAQNEVLDTNQSSDASSPIPVSPSSPKVRSSPSCSAANLPSAIYIYGSCAV